jgi:hypothetical protein
MKLSEEVKNINFKEVEDKLREVLKTKIDLTIDIASRSDGHEWVTLRSQNLVEAAGVFSFPFKEVHVSDFGSCLNKEETVLWIPIDLAYEHKEGGQNSVRILNSHYEFATKKWTFKLVEEYKSKF